MWQVVGEGRKRSLAWAVDIWEVPVELQWLCKVANDGNALLGELLRVGVLMAHHYESLTVDGELMVKLCVAGLEVVDTAVENLQS